MSKDSAEKFAEYYKRVGYNAVRFHHYDKYIAREDASSSLDFDPERLDHLDYLFACMKKNGIYATIDLFTARELRKGEIPEFDRPLNRYELKYLVPVLDSAMENWKTFARQLLTHKNPYTGTTWGEDPALISLCLMNEDNIPEYVEKRTDILGIYERLFEKEHPEAIRIDVAARKALFEAFIRDRQIKGYIAMRDYVRSLGVKVPTNTCNMLTRFCEYPVRDVMDMVDNHSYWEHPQFPIAMWKLPSALMQRSAVTNLARVPSDIMPTRIFGKPFTVTEINYCYPNHFRAEGGPLTGAYAALQGWDGIWTFEFVEGGQWGRDESYFNANGTGFFNVAGDPVRVLAERIVSAMYLRGDVAEAEKTIPYIWSEETGKAMDPLALGLCSKVGLLKGENAESGLRKLSCDIAIASGRDLERKLSGVHIYDADSPQVYSNLQQNGALGKGMVDMQSRVAKSDTGEIELDAKAGTFKVTSPRTESFVLLRKGTGSGSTCKVENLDSEQAVVAAMSLDGKPLSKSDRMLVLHLTDAQNTMTKFKSSRDTFMVGLGCSPILLRGGTAKIQFKRVDKLVAYRLAMDGSRLEKVPLETINGEVTLKMSTIQGPSPCFAYEIIKEN